MANNELSLENLTPVELPADKILGALARYNAEKQAYRDKYGKEEGEKRFYDALEEAERSSIRRKINERIYATGSLVDDLNRCPTEVSKRRFEKRLREVYGDEYDWLVVHRAPYDERVAELLIQDAIRTGAWEELPKALQSEYQRRVGGSV